MVLLNSPDLVVWMGVLVVGVCFIWLGINKWMLIRKRRSQVISELYSPGYALLLCKRSKKLETYEFNHLFRELLIAKSHLAMNYRIRLEIKDWLRNNKDPEGYRLQMLFENQLDQYYSPAIFSRFSRQKRGVQKL